MTFVNSQHAGTNLEGYFEIKDQFEMLLMRISYLKTQIRLRFAVANLITPPQKKIKIQATFSNYIGSK